MFLNVSFYFNWFISINKGTLPLTKFKTSSKAGIVSKLRLINDV